MKKFLLFTALLLTSVLTAFAQRTTDKLDRGLVAVPVGSGSFVSWRIFGEEYYDTEYNLYRDGEKVNDTPLKVSNYSDSKGKEGCTYQVAAVVRGVEQEKCAPVARLGQQYIEFGVKDLYSRRGTNITGDYQINDIALADVDGDGVSEFIMKRNYVDKLTIANDSAYNCIEVYNLQGERLWWIDLGPNMVSGPDEQYDAVGYDWDGDGRAEILMRGADNMIIHHNDGTTTNIGNMSVNTRNTVNQSDGNLAYTNYGSEYLLYLEGATGKPYAIGSGSTPLWMDYPLPRGNASDWGDSYGHRSTKHYFGAPFLDGRHPYIFLGRGCYTRHMMKAYSVDPATHQLTLYWSWENNNGWSDPWYGNGYHNYGIADVDWDGRDEICFGSMVIDDNGKGLSTTGLGHGDAQHCSDFDPYRHGQEIFACNEDEPAMNYRDATTSKIYYRLQSTSDDGRALCGNFSNNYPGAIGHSSQSGTISCVADKPISGGPTGFTNNWRIYWDGDLLEEGLDGRGTEGVCAVYKADGTQVFSTSGTKNCNWTKNTPSAVGDVLGDWREEIIVRTSDNKYVRVYTTSTSTKYRNYTLWHDHQYRQGMVWETIGYNQPPHASYFLGELEGITVAPPPLTNTGRVTVGNGSAIGKSLDGQHVLVCDYADTNVSLEDGAQPWVATFNVPSWVQGTNSSITNGNAKINYTYYTCNVTGGYLAGDARLVKQGDGVLNLPKTVFTHTGNTDIWAGTVNFDGTMLNTSLWLNRFAELNSDGGAFRRIKMDYDSRLRPGRADNKGTVTTDSLLLGFGSRVVFDIYNDQLAADQVNAGLLTIETKNWSYGPKHLMPVFEFNQHLGSDKAIAQGRYLLGTVGTIQGSLESIKIEGIDNKLKSQLVYEDGKLYLEVLGLRSPASVVWTGSESNVWDVADTENFVSTEDTSLTDVFVTGDKVYFDGTSSVITVTINTEIEADTVFVDGMKNLTLSGSGALTGNTTLVKNGSGWLTINNENSYTGGTRISGGRIRVKSLSNSTQPMGNLGGVNTAPAKFVIENGGILQNTAAVTQGSPMLMASEEGGVIQTDADFFVNSAISGTTLTKKGSGSMRLNVNNPNLTTLVVSGGDIRCVACTTPAKTVEFVSGTLNENGGSSYAVNVPKGGSGTWNLANRSSYTNKVTGEGTLTINCTTEKGSNYYATRTPVACNFSQFRGTLKPSSSLDDPDALRFTLNTSNGMPDGTMNIAAKVVVQNSGKTFRIGCVMGSGKLGGTCAFDNNGNSAVNTWQVGNDNNYTWGGSVTANANFAKVGNGTITFNGTSDNTGTTTISAGEMLLNGGKLGTGRLTVNTGATLSGINSSVKPLSNASVTINGKLRPGSSDMATTGALYFDSKNVTFGASGVLQVCVAQGSTDEEAVCAKLNDIGTLTMNGTIRVLVSNYNLKPGATVRLWNANKFAGTPKFELPTAYEWDTTRIDEGLITVKGTATDIAPALREASMAAPNDIFSLSGRVVRSNATSTRGLPTGIYVQGGRKIVVK